VVYESSPDGVKRFEIAPEDFGIERSSIDDLRGGSAESNAAIIRDILEGKRKDAARDLVLINAAASLHVGGEGAGIAESLLAAVAMALDAIESGMAARKLEELRVCSNRPE
jgi:anthranilate phosphoribosyltransferase